jgi:hypothetical protein
MKAALEELRSAAAFRYYFFFLPAFLAFFLAGFFLAMPEYPKFFAPLHEKFSEQLWVSALAR